MERFDDNTNYITVSELTDILKANIEGLFPVLMIKGEISNFKSASTGHWYFVLKDNYASINAIVFKYSQSGIINNLQKNAGAKISDGLEVVVEGKLSVYKKNGTYSIIINKMYPVGKGNLFQEFQVLKERLQKEGLFDDSNKREIPPFPEHIGIVTSPTGAALQDILNIIKRRHSSVKITVFPCSVQGDKAAGEIVNAIKFASYHYQNETDKKVDVLIITRGGGSLEDLWPFNEEVVARAIYNCPIPTISGVGHEVDFSISDFTADMRVPTPSAAAEVSVKNQADLVNEISTVKLRIERAFHNKLEKYHITYKNLKVDNMKINLMRILNEKNQGVAYNSEKVSNQFKKHFEKERNSFVLLKQKIEQLDPRYLLKMGYTKIYNSTRKGTVIKSDDLSAGDRLEILLTDGKALVETKEVLSKNK